MDEILRFLQTHPLFAGLDQPALDDAARCVRRRAMRRNEQILLEGDPAHSAYFVAQGRVLVYRLAASGRELVLADASAGGAFNLVPAVDGRPAPSGVVARSDGALYVISREDFTRLLFKYPAFAQGVLVDFAGRLRQLAGLVADLALRTVAERLARLLLQMAAGALPAERFTQQELANRLGTVREVISRTLRDFENDGLIVFDRHRIVIADRKRLEALAYQT